MFNRETKTIGNKLLSIKVPYDFQRSTSTDTTVSALHDGANLASIEAIIMPAVELVLGKAQDLVSKYVTTIEFQKLPESVLASPVSVLPIPQGFEEGKAAAITFNVSNKDPNSTLVILHQHFCLPYNDDFYLNIIGRCDASYESKFSKALDLAIQSRKLKRPLSIKGYDEIIQKEEKEAAEFWQKLKNEQESELDIENDDCEDLDDYEERKDDQQHKEARLVRLLDGLTNDFELKETKMCVKEELAFSAKFEAAGEICGIEIELDENESADIFIAEARNLLQKFEILNQRSKKEIADEMLNNYNNGWSEEGKQLTYNEFLNQLHNPFVNITEFDCSIFYETKDDLFLGHSLFVEYELFKKFKCYKASMIG